MRILENFNKHYILQVIPLLWYIVEPRIFMYGRIMFIEIDVIFRSLLGGDPILSLYIERNYLFI